MAGDYAYGAAFVESGQDAEVCIEAARAKLRSWVYGEGFEVDDFTWNEVDELSPRTIGGKTVKAYLVWAVRKGRVKPTIAPAGLLS